MSTKDISIGGRGGGVNRAVSRADDNLCAYYLKILSFNLLKPSGLVQAYNGIALLAS